MTTGSLRRGRGCATVDADLALNTDHLNHEQNRPALDGMCMTRSAPQCAPADIGPRSNRERPFGRVASPPPRIASTASVGEERAQRI